MIKEPNLVKAGLKALIMVAMALLFFKSVYGTKETEKKISMEITYEIKDNIIKFRPYDYTYIPKRRRVDVLLGRRFKGGWGLFTAYGYWKIDNEKRNWLGTRLDYGLRMLNDRLSANLELRFFLGLNERSEKHYYVIPTLYYKIDNDGIIRAGLSGYGKKSAGKVPFFYVGIDTIVRITRYLSTLLSYSIDVYGAGDFIYWKIYFNL